MDINYIFSKKNQSWILFVYGFVLSAVSIFYGINVFLTFGKQKKYFILAYITIFINPSKTGMIIIYQKIIHICLNLWVSKGS